MGLTPERVVMIEEPSDIGAEFMASWGSIAVFGDSSFEHVYRLNTDDGTFELLSDSKEGTQGDPDVGEHWIAWPSWHQRGSGMSKQPLQWQINVAEVRRNMPNDYRVG